MKRTITLIDDTGRSVRTTIDTDGDFVRRGPQISGVSLTGVYWQPRAQRVIVCTDSAWDDGTGRSEGERYHIADDHEIARLWRHGDLPNEAVELLPELGSAAMGAPGPHRRRVMGGPNAAMGDTQAMDRIFDLLDGQEWESETFDEIAKAMAATGREIRDPNDAMGDN